jgi:hypothetical protein
MFGPGSGFGHGRNLVELAHLVNAGLSPTGRDRGRYRCRTVERDGLLDQVGLA